MRKMRIRRRSSAEVALFFSQDKPLDLAAGRLGQGFRKEDLAWKCVFAQACANMLAQVLGQCIIADMTGMRDHMGNDDFTAFSVRLAHDRALGDRVVFQQTAFDIEWADPIA